MICSGGHWFESHWGQRFFYLALCGPISLVGLLLRLVSTGILLIYMQNFNLTYLNHIVVFNAQPSQQGQNKNFPELEEAKPEETTVIKQQNNDQKYLWEIRRSLALDNYRNVELEAWDESKLGV